MKLPLQKAKDLKRWASKGSLPWKACSPFLENARAVLIHRPRAVTTHKLGDKWAAHVSVQNWCGSTFSGGKHLVHGEEYAIVDIGLRMLTPRELYRAQGFPESYQIDHGGDGRPLTKTAQVRMCGNSVCPPMSRAIVTANYSEVAQGRKAA